MKRIKILSMMVVVAMVASLCSYALSALNGQDDYEVFTDGSTPGGETIEVYFRNNTGESVDLIGPVDVLVSLQVNGWFAQWPREALSEEKGDEILGGLQTLSVPPGDTAVIAGIAPGTGYDWRSFDTADYDIQIEIWVAVDGVDYHLEADWHEIVPEVLPYDLEMSTNAPVVYEDGFDTNLIISLTNNSASDITIEGPVVINPDMMPQTEREIYDLIGGDSITIPAGDTMEVVIIEAGPPMSWRNFYFPQIKYFIAFFSIQNNNGNRIWQSNEGKYCITGEMIYETWDAIFESVQDNGDGTATVTVTIEDAVTEWGVEVGIDGCEFYEEDPEIIGPVTGLPKDFFAFYKLLGGGIQEEIGKVLSVYETEPGTYDIVWSHEDGTHTVFIEINNPDPDYFKFAIVNTEPEGWDIDIEVLVSTQSRPVASQIDPDTNKHTGGLVYNTSKITFTADEEIDVEVDYRRKGETLKELPANANPAGIYLEISLSKGTLPDSTEIVLEIDYSRDDIPVGMNEENLRLYRFNEDTQEWDLLPDQTIDTVNKVITVILSGFSEFGVFEAPEEETPVDETPVDETPVDETPDESDDDYTDEMGDGVLLPVLGATVLISMIFIAFTSKKTKQKRGESIYR